MSCILTDLEEGRGDMTFDELIEKKEECIIDPYEAWDEAAWLEKEDYSLDILQWYLALIIRSV